MRDIYEQVSKLRGDFVVITSVELITCYNILRPIGSHITYQFNVEINRFLQTTWLLFPSYSVHCIKQDCTVQVIDKGSFLSEVYFLSLTRVVGAERNCVI